MTAVKKAVACAMKEQAVRQVDELIGNHNNIFRFL